MIDPHLYILKRDSSKTQLTKTDGEKAVVTITFFSRDSGLADPVSETVSIVDVEEAIVKTQGDLDALQALLADLKAL